VSRGARATCNVFCAFGDALAVAYSTPTRGECATREGDVRWCIIALLAAAGHTCGSESRKKEAQTHGYS